MPRRRLRIASVLFAALTACGGGASTPSSPSAAPSPASSRSASPTSTPSPSPSASQISSLQASASDAFVDSIGVNTHFAYAGSVYDSSAAEQAVEALGVRHIRDVSPGTTQAGHFARLAPHGIRFDSIWQIAFFTGPVSSWQPTPDGYANTVGGSNFDSYEGTNENNESCSGNASWVSQTRTQQSTLYAYMQSHGLSSLPLVAPSYGTCSSFTALIADATAMGSLSSVSNLGNVHWYPAPIANYPEAACLDAAQSAACGGRFWLQVAQIENPGQPVVLSETGAESQAGGCQKNSGTVGQERYDLRLLLNDWNAGLPKTYLFELLDDYQNDHCYFGLMNDAYVAKPAYVALRNMVAALADPGYSSFVPGKLRYALGGDLTNVDEVLLEKHTGTFELLLWQAVASVDGAGNPVALAPQTVTLTFSEVPSSVSAQTFTNAGTLSPVIVSNADHVAALPVTDAPVIVTIVP